MTKAEEFARRVEDAIVDIATELDVDRKELSPTLYFHGFELKDMPEGATMHRLESGHTYLDAKVGGVVVFCDKVKT